MNRLWAMAVLLSVLLVFGIGTIIYLDRRPKANPTNPAVATTLVVDDQTGGDIPVDSSTLVVEPPPAQPNIFQQIGNTIGNILGINPPPANPPTNNPNPNPNPAPANTPPADTPPAEDQTLPAGTPPEATPNPPPPVTPQLPPPAGQVFGVSIVNYQFGTPILNVNVGDTVIWTNNDSVPHTITALNSTFDSGTIGIGATYSRTFTQTGDFEYHCTLHSSMIGHIVVH